MLGRDRSSVNAVRIHLPPHGRRHFSNITGSKAAVVMPLLRKRRHARKRRCHGTPYFFFRRTFNKGGGPPFEKSSITPYRRQKFQID
jgi:hypothetical protein